MSFVLPVVLGHRGARAVKTENTIEAFRYACQSGVKWVELDAMLSADKTVMVFHDETLDRMAGVDGRLDEFTAERLRALTLKTGAKIPTLAEVLDVLNEFQACVNIEIKPSRPELARETARQVWQVIREKGFDDPDRLFFSSFAWDALEETLVFAPHIRRGVLVEDISGRSRRKWRCPSFRGGGDCKSGSVWRSRRRNTRRAGQRGTAGVGYKGFGRYGECFQRRAFCQSA